METTENKNGTDVYITGLGVVCRETDQIDKLANKNCYQNYLKNNHNKWFIPKKYLGERGYKYLSPATRYLLAANNLAIENRSGKNDFKNADCGVIVGTNFGTSSFLEEIGNKLEEDGTESISPMQAPYSSINLPASYLSMKEKLYAYNITLTTPITAGIEALIFGAEAIRRERSDICIAAATEDRYPIEIADKFNGPHEDGAACTIILEKAAFANDKNVNSYVKFIDGAMCFFNPEFANDHLKINELDKLLSKNILKIIKKDYKKIYFSYIGPRTKFGMEVNKLTYKNIEKLNIEVKKCDFIGCSGNYLTVSPLMQIAAISSLKQTGLIVASGLHGNIVMATIEKF